MNNNKIILVPGTIQYVKNYGDYKGLDIWINKNINIPSDAKFFIGHSLGVSFILNSKISCDNKFIFINPLVKKRNLPSLFIRWIKFHVFEGIEKEKIVPMRYWFCDLKQMLLLLKVDLLSQIQKIPRENIVVIRGKHDDFFCDAEDVEILKANKVTVIEVDAGHDWNENVAKAVTSIINNY